MKRWLAVFLFLFVFLIANGQGQYGWCGYALVEGLPLLENQLAVFEAITPSKSSSVNPFQLFQYRFSLDHSQVIIEGCFGVPPSRDVVAALLQQVIPASKTLVQMVEEQQADEAASQLQAVNAGDVLPITEIAPTATAIDPQTAVRLYIDMNLTLTIFAPGGTEQESGAAVRDYLENNAKEWEQPDQ